MGNRSGRKERIMKYSVVYSSRTGNTAQLAQAVLAALPPEDCIYSGSLDELMQAGEASGWQETPYLLAGFWTDKGSCDEKMTAFLQGIHHKKVFLFGTAGFGGSDAYFSRILENVSAQLPDDNTFLGTYMCQGKMPQSVRERYVKMKNSPLPIPNVDKMIENFDTAVSHPDETDLQKLKYAVAQCIKH